MSLFKSLSGLITPEVISSAASFLGEDKSSVAKAATSAIPSLLGSMLQSGDTPALKSVLNEASGLSGSLLSNIGGLLGGKSDDVTSGLGQSFLKAILGDKIAPFVSMIAGSSGLSSDGAGKLISSIAPIVAGFFGDKVKSGSSITDLLGGLLKEKDSFLSLIPSGLTSVLGVSSLAGIGSSLSGFASGAGKIADNAADAVEGTAKSGLSFLKYLIPILLILGLGYFLFQKSCSVDKDVVSDKVSTTVDAASSATTAASSVVATKIEEVKQSLSEYTLPSGLKLKGFEGGMEAKITNFLESDEYKKATAEELKNKWFDFDNIGFVFGSTTELTPESQLQIDNLVAILKEYKDVKVKIGAYTDKVGTQDANLKVSQSRANTVKNILTTQGVGGQVADAEGYGSKFATVDAAASDEARAIDRKISIRFEK